MYSNRFYLEIFPAVSGKGAAVKTLCELLNINPALSVAAGDAENDISMIEAAGTGIAMKNATPLLKEMADIVTDEDNEHDGLVSVLERFM